MSVLLRLGLRGAAQREDPKLAALHMRLLAGVRGVVVEIGCGRGALLRYYPEGVGRLVAIEPDPELRGTAAEAAERLGLQAEFIDGRAESIPLPDATADCVVCSEVFRVGRKREFEGLPRRAHGLVPQGSSDFVRWRSATAF